MGDKAKAAEAKALGNEAFKAQDFKTAITHFTEAIKHDPTDHVFFSNRSACYASLEKYEEALKDGAECVRLKPDWPKGYTRKGLAEFFLEKYDDAGETYKAGLKLAPEDPTLKEGLKKAMDAKYELPGARAGPRGGPAGGGGGGMPGMPSFDAASLARAAAKNPKIAEYMKDADLMQKVNMLMQLGGGNQQMQQQLMMQFMQQDPRILEIFMAAQGIDVSAEDMAQMQAEREAGAAAAPKKEAPKKKEEPPPPPPDERTPEQKEADEYKTKANAAYKEKKFAEALPLYDKAIELEPNELIYYNNKCAVWIEMGPENYDKVIETCEDLLKRRYEINGANPGGASFEKVAKVYARLASLYEKQKKYPEAIEHYKKSITEDNARATRNALRDCEVAYDKFQKEAYLDPEKSEEHRLKGNDFFKEQNWAAAKSEYDEAVKRNPKDAKLYSNRAAALTKLLAYPDALRDLDECLRLDPTFTKAYSRKGAAHFFMKEYNKALEAYDKGLKADPENEECKRGRDQVIAKIMETQNSDTVDEEQVAHAMADPEIQSILKDPQINLFLKEMQENPRTANESMQKDPKIANAVQKLMAAGIIRTK